MIHKPRQLESVFSLLVYATFGIRNDVTIEEISAILMLAVNIKIGT